MSAILDLCRNRLYVGHRTATGVVVTVNGEPLRHVRRYSGSVEWAYAGAGPTDLALSLLTDAIGPGAAERDHHAFTHEVVAGLPYNGWTMTRRTIIAWAQARAEQRDARIYADAPPTPGVDQWG